MRGAKILSNFHESLDLVIFITKVIIFGNLEKISPKYMKIQGNKLKIVYKSAKIFKIL